MAINGYWYLFYLWLLTFLMINLLMAISSYSIDGLFMVIQLVAIGGYFINVYWWLSTNGYWWLFY